MKSLALMLLLASSMARADEPVESPVPATEPAAPAPAAPDEEPPPAAPLPGSEAPAPLTFEDPSTAPAAEGADEGGAPSDTSPVEDKTAVPTEEEEGDEELTYTPPEGEAFLSGGVAAAMQYGIGTCVSGLCCGVPICGTTIPLVFFMLPYVGLVSSIGTSPCAIASGCGGCVGAAVGPALGSAIGTTAREWLGPERGTLGWACTSAYVTEVFLAAAMAGGMAIGVATTTPFFNSVISPDAQLYNQSSWFNPIDTWNWGAFGAGAFVATGSFALGLAGLVFLPPLAGMLGYRQVSEEKAVDDHDFRFPGLFSPNPIDDAGREERKQRALEEAKKERERQRRRREREEERERKQNEERDRHQGVQPAAFAF